MNKHYTFSKDEKLCSKKTIEQLFDGSNKSYAVYPLRAVWMDSSNDKTQIMISVAKKRFKHAVDRNRMKRLIREAYRLNKIESQSKFYIAFICIANELPSFHKTEKAMKKLLHNVFC